MSNHDWLAIFDWDGVVVDSSDYHEESWERLADEEGLELPPDHFERSFGMKNEVIIPDLLGWTDDPDEIHRLCRRKAKLYQELVEEKGISPLPGVEPFLQRLESVGMQCVVASSTPRDNLERALDATGLSDYFDDLVCGTDTDKSKPHPEPFVLAAERAGVEPDRCVVFEDAHVGIEAARRANMMVIGVATTHPAESFEDADRVVERLDELEGTDPSQWI